MQSPWLPLVLTVVALADAHAHEQCVCKPQMKLEWSPEFSMRPLCNNATMEWLVQTMMIQLSKQEDLVQQQRARMAELERALQEMEARWKLVNDTKQELPQDNTELLRQLKLVNDTKQELQQENTQLLNQLEEVKEKQKDLTAFRPRDCSEVQKLGAHISGVFTIFPDGAKTYGVDVYCDLDTDGGGWTVIQRRADGSEDFYWGWQKYKWGFGSLGNEFWLGNQKIYWITQDKEYELLIEMTDFQGVKVTAAYDYFAVDDEDTDFTLRLGEFKGGEAGDSLSHHRGHPFSTCDADHDSSQSGNCAELYGGAWWYVRCYNANLNGMYGNKQEPDGIVWFTWKENHTPIKHVEMKIRPIQV